jgi:hypothetical protein
VPDGRPPAGEPGGDVQPGPRCVGAGTDGPPARCDDGDGRAISAQAVSLAGGPSFSVPREFVRGCQTPMLVIPDDYAFAFVIGLGVGGCGGVGAEGTGDDVPLAGAAGVEGQEYGQLREFLQVHQPVELPSSYIHRKGRRSCGGHCRWGDGDGLAYRVKY